MALAVVAEIGAQKALVIHELVGKVQKFNAFFLAQRLETDVEIVPRRLFVVERLAYGQRRLDDDLHVRTVAPDVVDDLAEIAEHIVPVAHAQIVQPEHQKDPFRPDLPDSFGQRDVAAAILEVHGFLFHAVLARAL